MNIFQEKINEALERERKRDEDMRADERKHDRRIKEQKESAYRNFLVKCRLSKKAEYEEWLKGYLHASGDITHVYDYSFESWGFLTAMDDVTITRLYGANSTHIIIPRGVNCEGSYIGHNTIYIMDGFKIIGNIVPLFGDMLP
jgi:hypothetical protein